MARGWEDSKLVGAEGAGQQGAGEGGRSEMGPGAWWEDAVWEGAADGRDGQTAVCGSRTTEPETPWGRKGWQPALQ